MLTNLFYIPKFLSKFFENKNYLFWVTNGLKSGRKFHRRPSFVESISSRRNDISPW
jgi:hypothetical protein